LRIARAPSHCAAVVLHSVGCSAVTMRTRGGVRRQSVTRSPASGADAGSGSGADTGTAMLAAAGNSTGSITLDETCSDAPCKCGSTLHSRSECNQEACTKITNAAKSQRNQQALELQPDCCCDCDRIVTA
jgi:hypothetical protein